MRLKKMLSSHLGGLTDRRCHCDVKISLLDILIVLVFGVLAGFDSTDDIYQHADYYKDSLREQFGVQHIPSESTLRRVLRLIRPEELGVATLGIMQACIGKQDGSVVSIDGKAIRGSATRKAIAQQLRVLSAYDSDLQMTIGQVEVGAKTNEIPAMLDVLALFNVEGRIITADAMHCQKDTCRAIIKGNGDYVLQVKKNQKDLYEFFEASFQHVLAHPDEEKELQFSEESDCAHGRMERRRCYLIPAETWYDHTSEWPGLRCLVAVVRETDRQGVTSTEQAYYITSLLGTAAHLNRIVRDHWKIESMHWSLDVTFEEDACRITDRNSQLVLNILRKLALALHSHWAKEDQKASGRKQKPRLRTSILRIGHGDMEHLARLLAPSVDLEILFEKF